MPSREIADASKSGNSSQVLSLTRKPWQLFSSDDATVLNHHRKEGRSWIMKTHYHKTIPQFVRDQKASRNEVDTYQLNGEGKIKELDLIKKSDPLTVNKKAFEQ